MSLSQYIREINKASRHGKLVFFVGAGVSTLSGYPRWIELVDAFYEKLYVKKRDKDNVLSSDDYLRIPQVFYDVLEEHEKEQYDTVLEEIFNVVKEPNPIHYKILSLNPVHIITTNYDDLIEKTCWQRGKYFTNISSEKDVSGAISSRYLVKVHGDFSRGFKAENVVLKESDYINYDQNYPLISNLMKTIMATHTIVFIGYGLGDYNINLLLNWVKHLQKDGYKKPFFIRTDSEPIEDIDAKYYENKGLRIIDSAALVKTDKSEYLKRYSTVMDMLTDSRNNMSQMCDSELIDFIYQKVQPLTFLNTVRKIDLKYVFDEDYSFELNGHISNNRVSGQNYLERFFKISEKCESGFTDEINEKYEFIVSFFANNKIYGMLNISDDQKGKQFEITNKIENPIFNADFSRVDTLIETKTNNLDVIYRQAFYLAHIGEWEKSYDLYTEVISRAIEAENLWLHYLSQINRYHLYQSIKQTNRYLGTIGVLTYGTQFKPFSTEFTERIESELKNFNLNDLFHSMPEEFQEQYKILEFLGDNKFLYDETVKLFELTNKVRSSIKKGSVSLGGLTSENQILLRLYDTIRFLYENHMWSVSFSEFKQYVKNAMTLQFEKAEYDLTRDQDAFGFIKVTGRSDFYVDYFDFVSIIKTFSIEDIQYVERSCDINKIKFDQEERIEEYLLRIADKIETYYKDEILQMNIIFYNFFISELKSAIYLAKYVAISPECTTRLIEMILFLIPARELDNGKKYLWCERLTTKNNSLPENAISLIERFLLREANKRKDSTYSEMTSNSLSSVNFATLIHHYYPNYVSERLSEYAVSIVKNSTEEINYAYRLSNVLTKESGKYLYDNKVISDIKDVIDCLKAGDIISFSEYSDLVVEYVSDRITNIKRNDEAGISILYTDNYLVEFASQYFMGEIESEKLKDFKGVVAEYDMFIDPDNFDYSKFDTVWLKRYSDDLLDKMSKNSYIRNNILKILKERLTGTKDTSYLQIILKHFV